ncbi:MAG: S8 family peptidase [Muribaculaceae bacterium]|nr:S8 family peptidase [Muribaculaceae bacterium]
MKKYLLPALALVLVALPALSQSKISPQGRFMLTGYRMEVAHRNTLIQEANRTGAPIPEIALQPIAEPVESALLSLTDLSAIARIEAMGYEVTPIIDQYVVVTAPIEALAAISEIDAVRCVDFGAYQHTHMTFARADGNVDALHAGIDVDGVNTVFDGRGVITGLMDSGIDPNHANFRNADGSLRVTRVWALSGANAGEYSTPETIATFTTENTGATHGTHVAGIMCGGYASTATFATQTTGDGGVAATLTTGNNPYYGVATGSEICMSGGTLSDANIVTGVKNIIDYAQSAGKPVVVNMSLGSNIGPHDGTDYLTDAINSLGTRGIIVLSAGNEGDEALSLEKQLSANGYLRTFIKDNSANQGAVDIWSSTSDPITVSWVIYDTSTKTTTTIMSVSQDTNGNMAIVGTNSSYTQNADFNASFSGYIALQAEVDANNNRFHVYAPVSLAPVTGTTKAMGVIVQASTAAKVNIYGQSVEFAGRSTSGYTNGNSKASINNIAGADNVITVGSYTTRTRWGILMAGYSRYYTTAKTIGAISDFSSYGKIKGKNKPDICAPGEGIISSFSQPYIDANAINTDEYYTARANVNGRNSFWGNNQGTSMSAPFVSGVVALMLQADPTIDVAKAKELLNSTANNDDYTLLSGNNDRWGSGKVNAIAAVQAAIAQRASIGDVWADDESRLILNLTPGSLEVFVAGETALTVNIVDIQGRTVATASTAADSLTMPTGSIASGIYIVQAQGKTGRYTRKITL